MENVIATANFLLNGTIDEDRAITNLPVTVELVKSGAFDYGNGTAVMMRVGYGKKEWFDTRYEKGLKSDGSNFDEWAFEMVRGYVGNALVVSRV